MSDDRPDISIEKLPFFAAGTDPAAVNLAPRPPAGPTGAGAHLLAAAAGGVPPAPPSQQAPASPAVPPPVQAAPTVQSLQEPPATPPSNAYDLAQQLDWDVIARLRSQVSTALTQTLEGEPGLSDEEQQARARAHIQDVIQQHEASMIAGGGSASAWPPPIKAAAVYDSLFRLGRLQPLVELPGAENIDIYGFDRVYVSFADGTKKRMHPIGTSDAELISEIAFLAARGGEEGRSFTATSPILDMDLPGGVRLAAVHPPISPRPAIVLRIHRLVDLTLADLVEYGTLTEPAAALLSAAVRAGRSIVTSGFPGAGKTTLVRALANEIDPHEKIVTIEKERELYLDRMGDRHLIVTPLQYRPGQGERLADGSKPGEVSLVDLLEEALRLNTERIIVGEVRGGEIDAMFQAMQAGVGSLSTLHASSPTDAIERMATLTQKSLSTTATYAYRQIAQHINLIVQISRVHDRLKGKVRRVVTNISEVQQGESVDGGHPIAAPIFQANPRTLELVPVGRPTTELLELLEHAGFDSKWLNPREVA